MNVILRFLVSALTALAAWASASGCTSALVGATATAEGYRRGRALRDNRISESSTE